MFVSQFIKGMNQASQTRQVAEQRKYPIQGVSGPQVRFQASPTLVAAKEALDNIIKTFAIYELRHHYDLPPGDIRAIEKNETYQQKFRQYAEAKKAELAEFLPIIQQTINAIQTDFKVKPFKNENWQPVMSFDEAQDWARDSQCDLMLYHLTSGKRAEGIEKHGFSLHHTTSGAFAFLTKHPKLIANMIEHRYDYHHGDPAIVYARLNIPHQLFEYNDFTDRFSNRLQPVMQAFPLFWNIDKYQLKAQRIVMGSVMNAAGVKAVNCPYRGSEDGEVMILDPMVLTVIKKPHAEELSETELADGDDDRVTMLDFLPHSAVQKWAEKRKG